MRVDQIFNIKVPEVDINVENYTRRLKYEGGNADKTTTIPDLSVRAPKTVFAPLENPKLFFAPEQKQITFAANFEVGSHDFIERARMKSLHRELARRVERRESELFYQEVLAARLAAYFYERRWSGVMDAAHDFKRMFYDLRERDIRALDARMRHYGRVQLIQEVRDQKHDVNIQQQMVFGLRERMNTNAKQALQQQQEHADSLRQQNLLYLQKNSENISSFFQQIIKAKETRRAFQEYIREAEWREGLTKNSVRGVKK